MVSAARLSRSLIYKLSVILTLLLSSFDADLALWGVLSLYVLVAVRSRVGCEAERPCEHAAGQADRAAGHHRACRQRDQFDGQPTEPLGRPSEVRDTWLEGHEDPRRGRRHANKERGR